jgi:hypothetical protein
MVEFDNILRKWTILIPLTLHDSNKTKERNNLTKSARFIHWITNVRESPGTNQPTARTWKNAYNVSLSLDESCTDNFNQS